MKLRYQLRGLGVGIMVTALLMGIAAKDGIPMSDAEIKARALTLGMVESDSLRLSDVGNANLTPGPATMPPAGASADPAGTSVPNASADPIGTSVPDASADPIGTSVPDASADPAGTSVPNASADPAGTSAPGASAVPAQTSTPDSDASNSGTAPTDTPTGSAGGQTQSLTSSDRRMPEEGENITVVIVSGEIASEISRKIAEVGLVEDAAAFERYLCEIGCTRIIWDGTYTIPAGTSMEDIAKIIAKLE